MAKPTFTKEDFLTGAESGGYDAVPDGVYFCTIEKTKQEITENGARVSAIGYQIADDDETAPSQYIWDNHYTVKADGEVNLKSIGFYNKLLHELSNGIFTPDDFEWDDEGNIENEENVLAKLEGTEVKIRVKGKTKDGYTNYRISIQQVLNSTYGSSNGKPEKKETETVTETELEETSETEAKETVNEPAAELEPQEVNVGSRVGWINEKTGQENYGYIETIMGDESGGALLIKSADQSKKDLIMKEPEEIFVPVEGTVEEVELEEIEETLELKKGAIATYTFNGEDQKGTIDKVDEDEGKVHFLIPKGEGKVARRKVDVKSVTVVIS